MCIAFAGLAADHYLVSPDRPGKQRHEGPAYSKEEWDKIPATMVVGATPVPGDETLRRYADYLEGLDKFDAESILSAKKYFHKEFSSKDEAVSSDWESKQLANNASGEQK